jgi:hypothetical protein
LIFARDDLLASLAALQASADPEYSAIGENFSIEENVGDSRRDHFESYTVADSELRNAANSYFRGSVQGNIRGHTSSTFEPALNEMALLPSTIEPNQKIVRLERIDRLISNDPDLAFDRLIEAHRDRDDDTLTAFTNLFLVFPGERPAFAAFKAEVDEDLKKPDWVRRLILRMGLYHHFPIADGEIYKFALMEYAGTDVFSQAEPKTIERPFALATVLECQNNPAFFPVPRGSPNRFTVDFLDETPAAPTVREVLHIRLDYGKQHVLKFGQLSGPADRPDLVAARERHLAALRSATGRDDFGAHPSADVDV